MDFYLRLSITTVLCNVNWKVHGTLTPQQFEAFFINLETCNFNSKMCDSPAFYNTADEKLEKLHQFNCVFEESFDGTPGHYVACHPRYKTAAWYRDNCVRNGYVHKNISCAEEVHKRQFCQYSEVCLRNFTQSTLTSPSCPTSATTTTDMTDNISSSQETDLSHDSSTVGYEIALSISVVLNVVFISLAIYLLLTRSRVKGAGPQRAVGNDESENNEDTDQDNNKANLLKRRLRSGNSQVADESDVEKDEQIELKEVK